MACDFEYFPSILRNDHELLDCAYEAAPTNSAYFNVGIVPDVPSAIHCSNYAIRGRIYVEKIDTVILRRRSGAFASLLSVSTVIEYTGIVTLFTGVAC
jgi:hypothetical protein